MAKIKLQKIAEGERFSLYRDPDNKDQLIVIDNTDSEMKTNLPIFEVLTKLERVETEALWHDTLAKKLGK